MAANIMFVTHSKLLGCLIILEKTISAIMIKNMCLSKKWKHSSSDYNNTIFWNKLPLEFLMNCFKS